VILEVLYFVTVLAVQLIENFLVVRFRIEKGDQGLLFLFGHDTDLWLCNVFVKQLMVSKGSHGFWPGAGGSAARFNRNFKGVE
jgi:hypothetical protein